MRLGVKEGGVLAQITEVSRVSISGAPTPTAASCPPSRDTNVFGSSCLIPAACLAVHWILCLCFPGSPPGSFLAVHTPSALPTSSSTKLP